MCSVHKGRTEMCGMLVCTYVVQDAEIHTCLCAWCLDNAVSQRSVQMDRKVQERLQSDHDTSQHQPVISKWKKLEP
jgi:hypothetical protein